MIYLDYAASTPVDPDICKAYLEASQQAWANSSSIHAMGRQARAYLDQAGYKIATLLGADSRELIFTATATEANQLLTRLIQTTSLQPHVLVSSIEHLSVLDWADYTQWDLQTIPVNSLGLVEVDQVLQLVRPETELISLILASNEIGTIQPVFELAKQLAELNRERLAQGLPRIYLHTDASQTPLFVDLNLQGMGVDAMTLSSQKIYAPKGVGMLYLSKQVPRSIPRGTNSNTTTELSRFVFKQGTPNVPAIHAFALALEKAQNLRPQTVRDMRNLRDSCILHILEYCPGVLVTGFWNADLDWSQDCRIANNIHLQVPGVDQEFLLTYMDLQGICVSSGSSCQSGSAKRSHVLEAMQIPANHAVLRLTLGRPTSLQDMREFTQILSNFINQVK